MRLRIGYLPDSLPPSVPRTLLHLSSAAPKVQVQLGTGPALRLIEDLRARRLDAVVANLPAPTSGLRVTSLGAQRPIAALPVTDSRAMAPGLTVERLAPERLVVLPRDANPAFHNAVVSLCRDAGVAPTLVEVSEPRVELALLAVAAGAGVALLPASAAGRYATPGVRLVELEGVEDAFESALLTRPDDDRFATASLLRALARSTHQSEPVPERPPLRVAS
jgi:DNA-binding transcriptional LysR family regulator